MTKIYIINSQGEKEVFSPAKIYRSARKVGASRKLAKQIVFEISNEVYPGIKTSEIFKKVRVRLFRNFPQASLRFSLKQAMTRLGPTGFPFEKFMAEVFRSKGFEVRLNQFIPGQCGFYEIDFTAKKGNRLYIGECKYSHLPGVRVHLNEALMNYARFLDIRHKRLDHRVQMKSLLATNTKFSQDALRYSRCVGVEMLGWRYPSDNGLEKMIEQDKLYPITILPGLRKDVAQAFVSRGIMLVRDLLKLDLVGFSRANRLPLPLLERLVNQARVLLGPNFI